ncbi:uracil-DNA glycosylase [Ramlibacter sp.]|uniref:uracil-DNA glycosylase n=1 Tax=Ramlibacter sp. TaxID=1917967 RepID=UPI0039C97C45
MGIELFWPAAPAGEEAQPLVQAEPVRTASPALARFAPPESDRMTPAERAQPSIGARIPEPAAPTPRQPAPAAAEAPLRQRMPGVADMEWEGLAEAVAACRACRLCEGRTNTVFGVGDLQAEWMVVGEAPGENEDLQGEPFVGQAGKLLDNMLAALGIGRRQGAYIANVLKCRPPGNRNPLPEEIAQCEPFLRRQVELLRPKIILAMGRFAVHTLLQTTEPIGKLRGRVHRYNDVPVVVTYHPAYLLRNLPDKAKAWADLCLAQRVMQGLA